MANNYVFPSDLGTNPQLGHYMGIAAYLPSGYGLGSVGDNGTAYGDVQDYWHFYIPGGAGGTTFTQVHEYDDVKMARLAAGALGASSSAGVIPGAFSSPINPLVEVLFRNTQLREFQFTFSFSPSSEQEAETLKNGIQRLRYHSAPKIRTGGLLFQSPSEFLIGFYYSPNGPTNWQINPNMPKIGKCVLRNVEVVYNNDGEYSTFENGMPVQVQLTLVFREMRIIDKNLINQGY